MRIAHLSDLHIAGPLFSGTDLVKESARLGLEGLELLRSIGGIRSGGSLKNHAATIFTTARCELEAVNIRRLMALKSRVFRSPFMTRIISWLLDDLSSRQVDFIVITGDFTAAARPSEFRSACRFLRELSKRHRLGIVPGNHDLAVPLVVGPRITHKHRMRYFIKYFGWSLPAEALDGLDPYPLRLTLSDELKCILLDSTRTESLSLEAGALSERQLERLVRLLDEGSARDNILALHHPLATGPGRVTSRVEKLNKAFKSLEDHVITTLEESDRLLDIARRYGCRLILHGHKHQEFTLDLDGVSIHCAGTSLHPDLVKWRPPGYMIFEYSDNVWRELWRQYPSRLFRQ